MSPPDVSSSIARHQTRSGSFRPRLLLPSLLVSAVLVCPTLTWAGSFTFDISPYFNFITASTLQLNYDDTTSAVTFSTTLNSLWTTTNTTGGALLDGPLNYSATSFTTLGVIDSATLPGTFVSSISSLGVSGIISNFGFVAGETRIFASFAGSDVRTQGGLVSGLSYNGNGTAVPEPASILLFGLGLVWLGLWRYHQGWKAA